MGGDDFDKRIVDFLADDFKRNEGIDLRKDRQVWLQAPAAFGFHQLRCCSLATDPSLASFTQTKNAYGVKTYRGKILQALQRLTEAAEKAKIELSSLSQTSISLPFITATADGPKHIEQSISRAKFESMCGDLLERCRVPVERALKDANLQLNEINEVILVGGSTRIPAVQVWPCL